MLTLFLQQKEKDGSPYHLRSTVFIFITVFSKDFPYQFFCTLIHARIISTVQPQSFWLSFPLFSSDAFKKHIFIRCAFVIIDVCMDYGFFSISIFFSFPFASKTLSHFNGLQNLSASLLLTSSLSFGVFFSSLIIQFSFISILSNFCNVDNSISPEQTFYMPV